MTNLFWKGSGVTLWNKDPYALFGISTGLNG